MKTPKWDFILLKIQMDIGLKYYLKNSTTMTKRRIFSDRRPRTYRSLSILLFILAIIYFIVPVDFDGSIIGFIDDILLLLASITFCLSQFIGAFQGKSIKSLNRLSLILLILGIIWVLILSFSNILYMN